MSGTIQITGNRTVEELEKLLSAALAQRDRNSQLKVAKNFNGALLADIWAAIVVGTLLIDRDDLGVIVWENTSLTAGKVCSIFPLLVSALLRDGISDGQQTLVEQQAVKEWLNSNSYYIGNVGKGTDRAFLDFSQRYDEELMSLRERRAQINRIPFSDLLSHVRSELEVWDSARRPLSRSRNEAMESLSYFMKELYENACLYGGFNNSTESAIRRFGYFRARKIIEVSKERVLKRSEGAVPSLAGYVERQLSEGRTPALLEVSISDFGPGILNHFLDSSAGEKYNELERSTVFEKVIHQRLGANILDPDSGIGISQALKAAESLDAFVSLRTNEFFYTNLGGGGKLHANALSGGAPVRGTHWQFIWSPSE